MMKMFKLLTFIILFILNNNFVYSQNEKNDSIIINSLLKTNFNNYLDENVSDFLLDDNIKCFEVILFYTPKPLVISGIVIGLTKHIYLIVTINKFNHLNRFSTKSDWDKKLVYKELVSRIQIFYHDSCIIDTDIKP